MSSRGGGGSGVSGVSVELFKGPPPPTPVLRDFFTGPLDFFSITFPENLWIAFSDSGYPNAFEIGKSPGRPRKSQKCLRNCKVPGLSTKIKKMLPILQSPRARPDNPENDSVIAKTPGPLENLDNASEKAKSPETGATLFVPTSGVRRRVVSPGVGLLFWIK